MSYSMFKPGLTVTLCASIAFASLLSACSSAEDDAPPPQKNSAAGTSGSASGGTGNGGGGSANGGGGSSNGGSSSGGAGKAGSSSSAGKGGSAGSSAGKGGSTNGGSSSGGAGKAGDGGTAARPPTMPADVLPCFADKGMDAGDAISVELVPSRVEGVAPLLVYFDTDGTTADSTDRPFEELAYCWDFGDKDAGAFTTTGLSRNQAKGPAAAHVFEAPGTYSVTVSVRDKDGLVSSRAVEISVDDPETVFGGQSTVCYSSSGDFDGCPDGAKQASATSFGDLKSEIGTGKRLLLHRGETFSSGGLEVNVPGPGMVGAYGDGDPPTVMASGTVLRISEQSEPNVNDWRFADFNVVGSSDDSQIIQIGGTAPDILVLRVGGEGIGQGASAADTLVDYYHENGLDFQDNPDNFGFVDCNWQHLRGGSGHNFWYVAAHRLVILGTVANDSTMGEHVLRIPWADHAVISNNDLGNAPEPRHVVKLHAQTTDHGTTSNHIVFSDNIIRSTGGNTWSVSIQPQNDQKNEHIEHVIVERNLFLPGTAQEPLLVSAVDVVVRGNIFNRADGTICMEVSQRGIEPPPARITIENNTCYSTGNVRLAMVADATDVTLYNNLVVSPGANDSSFPSGSGTMSAGNMGLSDAGLAASKPGDDWKDYMPAADSPVVDAADDSVGFCPWDFSTRARPVGDAGDVGALEYAPK